MVIGHTIPSEVAQVEPRVGDFGCHCERCTSSRLRLPWIKLSRFFLVRVRRAHESGRNAEDRYGWFSKRLAATTLTDDDDDDVEGIRKISRTKRQTPLLIRAA